MLWQIFIMASFLLMHQAVGMSLGIDEDNFIAAYFNQARELLEKNHDVKPEYLEKIGLQPGDILHYQDEKCSLLCSECYLQVSNFLSIVIQNLHDLTFQNDPSMPQLCHDCSKRFQRIRKNYKRFIGEKSVGDEVHPLEIVGHKKAILEYNQQGLSYFFQQFLLKKPWFRSVINKIFKPNHRLYYTLLPIVIVGFYGARLLAQKHYKTIDNRFTLFVFLKYYPFKLLKTLIHE